MKTTYLSCAETAKLIRAQLKRRFPGTKFSVRSDTYSMGASIRVRWTDGPAAAVVEPVCKAFAGSGFDGSIDLKYSHSSWLLPDGTAMVASDPGTTGSAGCNAPERNWMPDPDCKLVHFGADYVFVDRDLTPELLNRVRDRFTAKGYPTDCVEIVRSEYDGFGHVRTVNHDPKVNRGFDMEREIYQAARRTHCVKAGH